MTHIYTHPMAHKIAVVTGSSKGIGKAIVIAFAKSNKYSGIVTNARKIEEAQTVSDEIKNLCCDSIGLRLEFQMKAIALTNRRNHQTFGRIKGMSSKQCRSSRQTSTGLCGK